MWLSVGTCLLARLLLVEGVLTPDLGRRSADDAIVTATDSDTSRKKAEQAKTAKVNGLSGI